ncbi:hypothetical protein TGAM01_v207842 [Trichoderma gamsii]|uniref:Uncharacterized protein n=1 Tax=Trichoderma gamsii TaxID=398673 RepID=A0A2P4ZG95_9HYPO|nr:hypothetical protein TGAM01_v207842 [Trichoderma gamsii]PON23315.1 hypothetical protein TGAM01_v207842 [Trichoderma gamsii]
MNLDTLTVFGPAIPCWSHGDLDLFIKYGRGWKELRYITHTSAFVDTISSRSGKTITMPSEPQPAAWQRDLENRDGPNSGASVTTYKSQNPKPRVCYVANYADGVVISSNSNNGCRLFGRRRDFPKPRLEEDKRVILIVVKRGKMQIGKNCREQMTRRIRSL